MSHSTRRLHLSLLIALLLLLLATPTAALAPLEPATGRYFGAWLNTTARSDTPELFNNRLGFKASMFQWSINIPLIASELPPVSLIDATGTDAILYLTVFPRMQASFTKTGNEAFDQLEPQQVLDDFVALLQSYVSGGRRVLVRIASEMNGSWFPWGQRPTRYVAMWRRFHTAVRAKIPASQNSVAFLFSPSSGNGYPFPGGMYNPFTVNHNGTLNSTTTTHPEDFKLLDTNGDGKLDSWDDAYSPYWPGAEYVDFVGLSLYFFGVTFPWVANAMPGDRMLLDAIEGRGGAEASVTIARQNFYATYAAPGGAYNKPMMISETAAAFHISLVDTPNQLLPAGPGALAMKQAFWRQYVTNSTFLATHPQIKGVCLFEWDKDEEDTYRDYRATQDAAILAAFKSDFFGGGNGSSSSGGNVSAGAAAAGLYLQAAPAKSIVTGSGAAALLSPMSIKGFGPVGIALAAMVVVWAGRLVL
ncbi:hypothetical protein HDU88_007548 [Geranomyces variabilis]|nr:hypothetical protein HDU88_007548 [Geranomyces variabilis]